MVAAEPVLAVASAPRIESAPNVHKWLITISVMLGTIMEVLDNTIVNVALPHMQGSFSASVDEIAWVATSYLAANGVMIPLTAWISSRFGRKRYFLVSVATFTVASGLCGVARSLDQMLLFRVLQGIAGAAMLPSSQAILMETFPPEEQQLAMAMWGMGMMVAPIAGPTLGGWITDNLSWRWNFYVNLPVGVLAFVMVSTFVQDPAFLRQRRARGGKVDYLGIIFLALGLGLGQMVLDRGQRLDWFNSRVIVFGAIASVTLIICLVIRELTFSEPILDLRIFKKRAFTLAVLLMIAMYFAMFGTTILNPIFLQELMGYSALQAGLVMAPRTLGTMFSMLLIGILARRGVETKPLIGVGFLFMAIGLWCMAGWDLQVNMWQVIWPNIVISIGVGMVFVQLSAITLSCVERERVGYAASLYNMMRNTGAALGVSYVTNLLIRLEQIHQAHLVEHFSIFDAWRLSKMAPPVTPGGMRFLPMVSAGQVSGLGPLYSMIQAQAMMLSFNDIYRMMAVLTLVLTPAFLVLKRYKQPGGSASAAAH